jgi:8-oxo-dGTP pyrophosphatase MutT (NUDIX family)
MIQSIDDFAPEDTEAGTGLALRDKQGRYLFMLAGTRHRCPPGELFYAGIGGHREPGEDWLSCAHREAKEEIDAAINLKPASTTWHMPVGGPIRRLAIADEPRPLALYDMIHPPHTPRAGELYHIVVYEAELQEVPKNLPPDELLGVLALSRNQVVRGNERKPMLSTFYRPI